MLLEINCETDFVANTNDFIELGQNTQRERVTANVLNNMESLLSRFENDPNNFDISKHWNNYCTHNNKNVSFEKENITYNGIFKKITSDGGCIIEMNETSHNYSGELIKNLQILI